MKRVTGTLLEDQYTLVIVSRSVHLRMRNISDKSCKQDKNRHIVFNDFFFKSRAVYEIMRKNIVEQYRPQMTKWPMRIACWVPKTTSTKSEYVIIFVFPLQQSFYERDSELRYTYIACLVDLCSYATCNR